MSPQPYYADDSCTIYHGDSFDLLHDLSGIGAVVTDPPYSSGGAFRGDRAQQTTTKYVNSDTQAYRPEWTVVERTPTLHEAERFVIEQGGES